MPVLEAQSCGCPVVCSNSSALPEVVGDSAVLVNLFEIEDIKKAMELVLYNQKLKKELIEKGYENVKRFSWEKTAKRLRDLFYMVLK